jgi:5-methylcytosine-specific restriction endonuclease McrA
MLNNDDGSIVALTIFAPNEATPEELFELVNMAIPVPEYIVSSTLDSKRRDGMHAVDTYLRRTFKEYVSDARTPRKPNFNPSHVVDAMMRSDPTLPCTPKTSGEWCGLVEYVNNAVLSDNDWSAHIKSPLRRAYVLAQWDPLHSWAASSKWAYHWDLNGRQTINDTNEKGTKPTRVPIPVALRNAVWNTYTGGPEVGEILCACCETTRITQQTFECGHIIAAAEGGSCSVDNMRPVCRGCNRSMGKTNMQEFKRKHFTDVMDTDDQ